MVLCRFLNIVLSLFIVFDDLLVLKVGEWCLRLVWKLFFDVILGLILVGRLGVVVLKVLFVGDGFLRLLWKLLIGVLLFVVIVGIVGNEFSVDGFRLVFMGVDFISLLVFILVFFKKDGFCSGFVFVLIIFCVLVLFNFSI